MDSRIIKASDNKELHLLYSVTDRLPKAIILIIHGMAEHAARYDGFAQFLNSKGFDVYIPDLRGHGKTVREDESKGHFADKNGWNLVIEDIETIVESICKTSPKIPFILLGHSMGSLLARSYFEKYGKSVDALILSGTSYQNKFLVYGGLFLCYLQQLLLGQKYPSKLLTKLSFGSYNKKFKNTITDFDWLSRDTDIPARYVADEFCGFTCTVGFFRDLFEGILSIQAKRHYRNIPKHKPVFILSGSVDPVGQSGKGICKVYNMYSQSGVSNIQTKLYPDGRHEMLNEINRLEVYEDIYKWIEESIKKPLPQS